MTKSYPFSAVLFDMDGVIINTTPLYYRGWAEFGRSRGYAATQEELFATNGVRAQDVIKKWLGSAVTDAEADAITIDLAAQVARMLATETVLPIPGAQNFVTALAAAGIPRAIATSALPANASLSLARVGLANSFGAVITANDVTHGKPHPEPWLKAAAALGVPAAQCIVFEDSVSGLRAAKAAGAKCVALATTFPREVLQAEQPDWLINDFLDLPAELRP